MEQRRKRSIGSGMQKWLMRKVSWFLSSASYQASQKPMESQQVIRTLWTFVDIGSARLSKNSSRSRTDKPRAPSAALPNRSVRLQTLGTCVESVRRR